MSTFDVAINRVLGNEGFYSLDPDDPGGETVWGVSRRSFPNFNGGDFKNATRAQAIELYRTEFWQKVSAESLPELLQFQALDFAVNCGISTAIRKVQTAAGVADDGHFGPISLAAIKAANPVALTFRFFAEELDYRRRLSGFVKYGSGWTGRVANDLRFAADDLIRTAAP